MLTTPTDMATIWIDRSHQERNQTRLIWALMQCNAPPVACVLIYYRVLVEVNGPDARVRYPPPPGRRRHVARRGRSGGEEGGVERGERRGRGGHGCCAALRRLRRGWLWLGPEDIPSGRGGAFCTACFPPSFLWLCMTRTHALVGDVASRPATKLGPAAAAPSPFLAGVASPALGLGLPPPAPPRRPSICSIASSPTAARVP